MSFWPVEATLAHRWQVVDPTVAKEDVGHRRTNAIGEPTLPPTVTKKLRWANH